MVIFYLIQVKNHLEVIKSYLLKTSIKLSLKNGIIVQGENPLALMIIIYEIFKKEIYTATPLSIGVNDIVVDIGANVGIFSIFAAKKTSNFVYAYEPFPQSFENIKKNAKNNSLNNIKVFNQAVSSRIGEAKLYIADQDSGNLLFDYNLKGRLKKYIKVKTITLEKIFRSQKLSKIDFLKIDCEGSEGDIFLSTPDEIFKNIYQIAIEFHDNVSKLTHVQIIDKLTHLKYKTKIRMERNSPFGYIYAWKN